MSEWPLGQPPERSICGLGPWRLDLGPFTHIRSITVNYGGGKHDEKRCSINAIYTFRWIFDVILHVYTYPSKPLLWIRFIDDNFMIWTHGRPDLDNFIQHLNISHPCLKFTFEASETSFLDTLIQLDQDRMLYTTLYNKHSDSYSYLHFSSCHPHH